MLVVDVEAIAIPDVDTYLEPVSAPSNYKDPEAIKRYELEARDKQAEKAALDIDLAQIVAIGVMGKDWTGPLVRTAHEMSELKLIEWFFDQIAHEGYPLITFNGLEYDVPLVLRRCLYMGLKVPDIKVDRFRHPQVIDLMQLLSFNDKRKVHSLSFYANRFGVKTDEPDIKGSDISKAWASGDYEAIERHCRLDVSMTYAIAKRMNLVVS